MKGWIDLETAADQLAQRTRHKAFRSLSKSEAKKVLRELRDLVVAGILNAQVEGERKRYRQLNDADALSQPFGIHFELDNSVGAETVFEPGVLRPMLLRKADFDTIFKLSSGTTNGLRFLTRRDLEARGIPYSNPHLISLENAGKFPKRRRLSPSRVAWVESEIDDWMAERPR